ncbi:MAG: CRTAC1 family protein [Gammaproteobacteria bacterium]
MINAIKYTRLCLVPCLIVGTISLSACHSDDDDDHSEPPPPDTEHGTTFSNESDVLAPYQRTSGEGYAGVAWLDYDRDNDLDVFLTNEKDGRAALMRNNGDGTFTDVTIDANAIVETGNSGIVVGDIDNDGYPDIFMSGTGFFAGPEQSVTVLLHNQGDGTFVDIAATANVPGAETALSAAMGDINNDGYVDLFVTAEGHLAFGSPVPREQHDDKLYLNNGNLTFTDITIPAGVTGGLGSCVASFSHFDDDEYIDLFVGVCNDVTLAATPWHVYKNNGDNTFTDVAASTRLDKGGFWMSSTFGDIDNDGDFDIYATNLGGNQTHHLWRNNGDGTYVNIAPSNGDRDYWAWGATFADFDNDGFQDLYYAGELPGGAPIGKGNKGYLFFNNGDSRFTVDETFGLDLRGRDATGVAKADYDGDGFVDFIVTTGAKRSAPGTPVLMRNNGNSNKSLSIRLEGTDSNRMAIGARIEIFSDEIPYQAREIWAGSSFVSNESPWPVFGLGQSSSADAIVYWPSGLVEHFENLDAGELHHLLEGTGVAD